MRPVLLSFAGWDLFPAPVFAGMSAVIACLYFGRFRTHARLSVDDYWILMGIMAATTMAGAVLHYYAFYGAGLVRNASLTLRYGRILGGAFYGNLWGATLGILIFARLFHRPARRILDLLGGAAPLALSWMRLGCLQSGCCHGVPTDFPVSIVFDSPRSLVFRAWRGIPLHPAQIYESIACLLIFLFVHFAVFPRVKDGRLPAGSVFSAAAALYAAMRFFMEYIRGGEKGYLRPFGLTTSQTVSVLVAAAAAGLFFHWRGEGRRPA